MPHEARQEVLAAAQALEFHLHSTAKVMCVRRREVCKSRELGVIPDPLVGIEFRSIGRKSVRPDTDIAGQVFPDSVGLVVNVASVPNDVEGLLDLATQLSQEPNNVVRSHVPVRFEKVKVETESVPLRTQRDRADGGDPIVTVPALLDRGMPSRGECAPHERGQHEA
jgi:hypothetical protein